MIDRNSPEYRAAVRAYNIARRESQAARDALDKFEAKHADEMSAEQEEQNSILVDISAEADRRTRAASDALDAMRKSGEMK